MNTIKTGLHDWTLYVYIYMISQVESCDDDFRDENESNDDVDDGANADDALSMRTN